MGQALSKLGGTARMKLINKWKETDWSLKTITQQDLLCQKRQLEKEVKEETTKRLKLESDTCLLKKEVKALTDVTKKQAKTIVSLTTGKSVPRRPSKSWNSYSASYRCVKRKSIATGIKAALSVCDQHFVPLSVDVENIQSGEKECIDLKSGSFKATATNKRSYSNDDMTHFALFVKDQFSLSDSAWREISQLSPDLPRLCKIKELSSGLNSHFSIMPSPNGNMGVQQSFKSRLLYRAQKLDLEPGETIKVKLTGDGTYIAKHIHVVNVAFTILNEGPLAKSPVGNHSIAVLQVPEDYGSLSSSLSDIIEEARELKSINVNEVEHEIEYFLGGDMKFLAIMCGIESATARFSCIWCKCPSEDRWDMTKEWSAFDTKKGARTIDEIERFMALPKNRRKGCQGKPIFSFIPIDHVIIDTLHLYLRVSDLLINLFIQDLRRHDGIQKSTQGVDSSNITVYEKFLNDKCKIHFKWYTSKETKQLQWRDLSGPEKDRLFQHMNIPKYFPEIPNAPILQDLWTEFCRLFRELEKHDVDHNDLQQDVKNWVKRFLQVYQTKNITPYVHSFAYHAPEFIEHYGNICQFTQQGLEKLNDLTTQHYLRSTNHRNLDALKQVLEKRNRLEELADSGFKRTVNPHQCSICRQTTHNKRTCPSRPPLSVVSQN
jgi:hypothetical protein